MMRKTFAHTISKRNGFWRQCAYATAMGIGLPWFVPELSPFEKTLLGIVAALAIFMIVKIAFEERR